jgi:cytochrome b6-f complex iron-sulfur subunit
VNGPHKKSEPVDSERRRFLRLLGKGSVAAAFVAQLGAAARAFYPNVLYEPPTRFKLKRPEEYPPGFTFDPQHRLFVVRDKDKEQFHVISAICTHLGCTVQWRGTEFDCPCHGSRFNPDGSVIGGPAPRPLSWFDTALSPDGFLEVDTTVAVAPGFRFVPKGKA